MKYNKENIEFYIPKLENDWIRNCYLKFENNTYKIFDDVEYPSINEDNKLFTIFHYIVGDIPFFHVNLRNFSHSDSYFNDVILPVLKKYCSENKIELKFD